MKQSYRENDNHIFNIVNLYFSFYEHLYTENTTQV